MAPRRGRGGGGSVYAHASTRQWPARPRRTDRLTGKPRGVARAALYARVATAAQGGAQQAALAAQAAICERHCVARGYEVVARCVDVGSGNSEQRDGYRRLLDDVVVAADPARFGRAAPLLRRLLASAAAAGVRVETVRSGSPIPLDLLLAFDHQTEHRP